MDTPIKILYVDDEVGNLNYFKSAFRREFKVLIAGSGAEGLEILKENSDIPSDFDRSTNAQNDRGLFLDEVNGDPA